jgi:hypothetical protein
MWARGMVGSESKTAGTTVASTDSLGAGERKQWDGDKTTTRGRSTPTNQGGEQPLFPYREDEPMPRKHRKSRPHLTDSLRINRASVGGQWRRAHFRSRCRGIRLGCGWAGCGKKIKRGELVFWLPGDGVLCSACAPHYGANRH